MRGLGVVGVAAIILVLSGLVVTWGSLEVWGTCPQFPCDPHEDDLPFPATYERYGIDFGVGFLTALAGLASVVAGISVIVIGPAGWVVNLALGSAGLVVITVAAYLTVANLILRSEIMAALGLYAVGLGGLVGLLAGGSMRRGAGGLEPQERVEDRGHGIDR